MTTPMDEPNEFLSDGGLGDNYGRGWSLIFSTFGVLLAVTLIFAVIRAPSDATSHHEGGLRGLGILAIPYDVFVVGPIGMSLNWVFLRAARKEKIQVADMFSVFERNYWNAVGAGILKFIIIAVGFVLLIVPGIFLACRLAFVDYLIIDRKMDTMEALRTSWAMTRGHGWTIFGMGFLAIFIVIAGLLALLVGVFIAVMWFTAAFAILYHSVERREGIPGIDRAPPPVPTTETWPDA